MPKGGLGKTGAVKTHAKCPRCGKKSYHIRKKECSSCHYGISKKTKNPPPKKKKSI
jgi:ribosomal protein L37E